VKYIEGPKYKLGQEVKRGEEEEEAITEHFTGNNKSGRLRC
jgi:hypothetical protein